MNGGFELLVNEDHAVRGRESFSLVLEQTGSEPKNALAPMGEIVK
jgi:hypothetical protein